MFIQEKLLNLQKTMGVCVALYPGAASTLFTGSQLLIAVFTRAWQAVRNISFLSRQGRIDLEQSLKRSTPWGAIRNNSNLCDKQSGEANIIAYMSLQYCLE